MTLASEGIESFIFDEGSSRMLGGTAAVRRVSHHLEACCVKRRGLILRLVLVVALGGDGEVDADRTK
jgi:hypothetical protein